MALTEKQLAFCLHFVQDYDRLKTMERMGYEGKHPAVQAHNWLQLSEVKAKISELQQEKIQTLNLHTYDVLRELALIIKSDIKDFVNADNTIKSLLDLPSEKTRAVSSITVTERYNQYGEQETQTKLTFWDKNSALDKLGKHFGTFEVDNAQKRPVIAVMINENR